jgi:membrane protease YdiL (CAAX protease family)
VLARIFLSPGERRLRAGWRLLLHGALTGLLLLVFSLVVLLPLTALSVAIAAVGESLGLGTELTAWVGGLLQSGPSTGQLLALSALVSFPAFTLATWIARRAFDRRPFGSLGFEQRALAGRDLLVGFCVPGLLFVLVFGIEWGLGWVRVEGWLWESRSGLGAAALVLGSLLVFVLVGFYEELAFRGYYLLNLQDGMGRTWAVLLSAVAFALAHTGNPSASWASFAGLLAAGLILAYAQVRTGQLWLPIGLHLGWNFFEGTVFGFAVSGTSPPGLLQLETAGPALLTGGGFGPEAGLIVLPAMLLGAGLIWLYTRGRSTHATSAQAAL